MLDTDWQGEGYDVSCKKNDSVRVPNSLRSRIRDGEPILQNRRELAASEEGPSTMQTVDSIALWDKVAYTAWACVTLGPI